MINSNEIIKRLAGNEIIISIEKLYIELTNRCNLKCKHCYNNSNCGINKDIPINKVEMLLRYVADCGLNSVALSGGETILYPDIEKVLELCEHLKLKVMLLTNGTLFDKQEFMNLIIKYKPDIQVSLDGPNAYINDSIRGEGSFDRTICFLKLLKKMKYIGSVSINTVITSYSIDNYQEMIRLIEQLNISMLTYSIMTNVGRARDSNLQISKKQFKDAVADINGNLKIKYSENCQGVGMNHSCSLRNVIDNVIFLQPKVTYNGDVYPCQMHNDELYKIGNIYDLDLKTILNSEKARKYLILMQLRDFYMKGCVSCAFKKICKRGCIAKAINDTNNPFETDGCCDFYKEEFINQLKNMK